MHLQGVIKVVPENLVIAPVKRRDVALAPVTIGESTHPDAFAKLTGSVNQASKGLQLAPRRLVADGYRTERRLFP